MADAQFKLEKFPETMEYKAVYRQANHLLRQQPETVH